MKAFCRLFPATWYPEFTSALADGSGRSGPKEVPPSPSLRETVKL